MALSDRLKKEISEAFNQYVKTENLTTENLIKICGFNEAFINAILRGDTVLVNTKIQDSYFKRVACVIGYRFDSEYWKTVDTSQFFTIYNALLDSKINGNVKMIIGETGCGKTYTVDWFKKECPLNTYVITVNSLFKVGHIIDEFGKVIGVKLPRKRDSILKLKKIVEKLKYLKNSGKQPILIIDEAENLTINVIKMLKGLYDSIKKYCSIALIGTPQLLTKMEKLVERDIDGMPQFYSRFEAGLIELEPIDKEKMFVPFFERVEDENLKTLLTTISNNYRVLNNYLEAAMKAAADMNSTLDENFFLQLHKNNRRINRLGGAA